MTADEIRSLLKQRKVVHEERQIEYGHQFRCKSGEIFNVFDSGRVAIQGTKTDLAAEVAGLTGAKTKTAPVPVKERGSRQARAADRRVFIVYGHDTAARDQLELLLHRWDLDPIILENLPAGGDTIIEKLEEYLGEHGDVGFACVLLTPDDEGYPSGKAEQKRYRARQNVILELGMVLGRLGRKRVAILYKESVEQPSDIAGLIYLPFQERIADVSTKLFQSLREAGYDPNPKGL